MQETITKFAHLHVEISKTSAKQAYTMGNMQLQAPITSTILYPLLISVFVAAIHARNYHQICTSSCGDIQNISYPFRLKTDPTSCGDTDYELSCQYNQTILEFHSGKYLVKKISYDESIIRLVDINFSNIGSSSNSCNLPSARIASQSEITKDYRYRSPRLQIKLSFTSFLNCSTNITHPAYTRVPCFGTENNSSSSYYIYAVYEGYLMPDPLQQYDSCLLISMAPADYADFKFPSYEVILELLKSGFDLGWSVMCRDCLLSGSSCTISSWDKPLVYVCGERAYWDSEVHWAINSIGVLIDIALSQRFICAIVIYVFLIHKFCTTRSTVDNNMENNMKVEESTPSTSMINNVAVEMPERNNVVNVNDKEIWEVHSDSSLSSPPHTSMEIELHSDSSTEWLISESMEKDSTKVTHI